MPRLIDRYILIKHEKHERTHACWCNTSTKLCH